MVLLFTLRGRFPVHILRTVQAFSNPISQWVVRGVDRVSARGKFPGRSIVSVSMIMIME